MKRFLYRLFYWWSWRHYGICPIHRVMARHGGGYEPKWICDACDRENRFKNIMRGRRYDARRKKQLEKLIEKQEEQLYI